MFRGVDYYLVVSGYNYAGKNSYLASVMTLYGKDLLVQLTGVIRP